MTSLEIAQLPLLGKTVSVMSKSFLEDPTIQSYLTLKDQLSDYGMTSSQEKQESKSNQERNNNSKKDSCFLNTKSKVFLKEEFNSQLKTKAVEKDF